MSFVFKKKSKEAIEWPFIMSTQQGIRQHHELLKCEKFFDAEKKGVK